MKCENCEGEGSWPCCPSMSSKAERCFCQGRNEVCSACEGQGELDTMICDLCEGEVIVDDMQELGGSFFCDRCFDMMVDLREFITNRREV